MGTDGGGDYASIDPGALGSAVGSLQQSVDGVNNTVPGLKSEFTYFGIPTGNLDTLTTVAQDLAGLIPELRRRQSMAAQLVAQDPAGGKVAYFQGDLLGQFETVAAATAQAHIDAEQVKHAQDHQEPVPESVYQDLQKYGTDADYSAAFVNDLGTDGVAWLLVDAEHAENFGDPPDQTKMSAVGTTLATASYRVNFDSKYLHDLNMSLRDMGVNTNAVGSVSVFTPMLQYGTWSETSLSNIADIVLNKGGGFGDFDSTGPVDASAVKMVFTGLANNPIAAGDYFANNREWLYDTGKYSDATYPGGPAAQAYADFVRVATVDSRSAFAVWALNGGPKVNVAEDNAQWLIHKVANDDHPYEGHEIDLTYAAIASEYIGDMAWSIGSPIDAGSVNMPNRDGIELSQADWKGFLKVPMNDDEAAARLAATFGAWMTSADAAAANDSSSNPDANFWDDYTIGRMRGLFLVDYQAVMDEKGRSAQEQQDAIDNVIDKGVDWATDPTGIPKDVLTTAAKDLLSAVAHKIEEDPSKKLNLSDFSDNHSWQTLVQSYQGKIDPYNDGEVTWDGNPKFYEDLYGGRFTDDNGNILPLDQIKKDPKATEAFNEWLKDPAVQAKVAEHYKSQDLGQDDASLPGG